MNIEDFFEGSVLNRLSRHYSEAELHTIIFRLLNLCIDVLDGKRTDISIGFILEHLDTLSGLTSTEQEKKLYWDIHEKLLQKINRILV
jgi:hypothetical protein